MKNNFVNTYFGGGYMEILLDSIKDTLMIVPSIFIIYFLMAYLGRFHWKHIKIKKTGPIIGGIIGLLPECGTSILAAKLFSQKQITLGTLVAIFVASSDEAVILLLGASQFDQNILWLLFFKLVFGILLGLITNYLIPWANEEENIINAHTHHPFSHALNHTIKIVLFVFISQIIISSIIAFIGEQQLISFLMTHKMIQPIIAGFIGLIPNCAGSLILAQVYLNGMLSFGALFTGLACSTGLGLMTLFKYHKNKKQCLFILLLIYFSSLFAGYVFYR